MSQNGSGPWGERIPKAEGVGVGPDHDEHGPPRSPQRERLFSAPWPVLTLIAWFCAGYALQVTRSDPGEWLLTYGLIPIELSAGRWSGLITSIFLHQDLLHLAVNCAMTLAFGVPTARLLGPEPGGALLFAAFFLLCGVAGGGAFWALHPQYGGVVMGASGGVSGLMGAAARLIPAPGRVSPLFSPNVLGFTAALVLLNLIIAVVGFAPGIMGASVAWEAHLGGLFAGLLLIGPFARLRGRGRSD